ncbi:ABC transporter ATP-binding protein [Nocardioides zeae]|uniref:ABC transporter ATP-binding protein n=1 Tax=Nocardioides zeae TaxID=1457234 RepID=A0A6P0HPA1_9ACTN|nr:ABC transporter ATP-binding protein [Nocardioides zeae]NEN80443.1 ABC transporter ATP-binding protein [Nocardioides zeae]
MLQISDLHVSYGHVEAVAGIDLEVRPGQVSLVLGPNGAGKSTTLNAVAGVVRPARGSVRVGDLDTTGLPAHRVVGAGVALVPEGRRVFAPMTVEENLRLGGHTTAPGRAREVLERIWEIFPVLHERRRGAAGLLSGGEQQMLAFGRALVSDPAFVLLDEPSMGLAPAMVDVVVEKVGLMAESGIGVLMVEQNAEAGLGIASDVTVVNRGQVAFRGTSAEVRADASVLRAFLGESALAEG